MAVAALVLVAGGCGRADGDEAGTSAGSSASSSAAAPTSTVASTTTASEAPTSDPGPDDRPRVEGPARLAFHPVLDAAVGCATTPESPLDEVVLPVAPPQPGPCARLGPAAFDGTAVAEAEAVASAAGDGTWQVAVTIAVDGRGAAGALFDACAEAAPTCPDDGSGHGRVAVVVDGAVVSSPSVASVGLAEDELVVAGTFTRAEAEDLAASLGA